MEKFLVIQTAFIGDSILTLPMLQILKKMNPECNLDVVSIPETAVIFNHSPVVNNVIVFDKRGKHKSGLQIINFAKLIRENNYSRIYAPHRSARTSLIVMLSGVRETYGFNINSMPHIYKYLAEYEKAVHEVERNLKLIQFNTVNENWKILPILNIPDEAKNKVDKFFSEYQGKLNFAAIAPGSVWNTKKYPAEYYEEIIKFLLSIFDIVFFTGGENDKEICAELEKKAGKRVRSVAGSFNLIESVVFLKKMKLLISNDSAAAHLGMCSDIPVLMLYCSTVPDFGFYPYNKNSYFLSYNDLFCKPCGIHGFTKCPLGTFDCGYKLKPEMVISKIKEIIND
ncbi:MAG TPA: glycosyltransferase family 9 protein [Ignavibacteriaceae bacterium]|nr:glycosyltransferase family 9 protein [Ignavibacteriaceae bacterium]